MNILLLNGSPRTQGNTAALLDAVLQGINSSGRTGELLSLAHLKINPCIGCGNCEQTGECIFDDDMQSLYRTIAESQRIVIGSPIYFYSVTAQAKAFIDRCQVFWSRKYLLGRSINGPDARKGYFLSVAATGGSKIFDGAQLTVRYLFDAMDCSYAGEVFVKGVDAKGAVHQQQDKLDRAFELGQQLCLK